MKKCPYCSSNEVRKNGLPEGRQRYKCKNCGRNILEGARLDIRVRVRKKKPTRPCTQCGKETTNPKFCSRSCWSTYCNLNYRERYEKRRKQRYCRHCAKEIEGRRTTCDNCNKQMIDWDNTTIEEVTGKAKYQIHAQIRQRARLRYRKSSRPKYCVNCGYDKHIEVCHIHAIAGFPPETNVSEINDLKNLVALCPNCHWELDKGSLSIEEIRNKNDSID